MLIEVFKTKVSHHLEAFVVSSLLKEVYPAYSINFDLEDCDKIMRIKSEDEPIDSKGVVTLLNRLGFCIEILENDQPQLNKKLLQSWPGKSL